VQALAGPSAIVLGILALTTTEFANTLSLVALIVLDVVLAGSTLTGVVMSFMPQWSGELSPKASYSETRRTGLAE
jgi:hypothetical protein